jgi:hypothetical protein
VNEVIVAFTGKRDLNPDDARLLTQQLAWVRFYDGYRRLADSPERLGGLLVEARREFASSGAIPSWCGVDFLKGWAFYVAREDSHATGGYSISDPDSETYAEWHAVLAALAAHSAAELEDRPPMPPTTARNFASSPRAHKNPDFLAAKRARLWEPHVAPVNRLVQRIVEAGKGDVPFIDPDSGGIAARVLFLLEAPARAAAHGSGMLSADNDDTTAAHVWEGYQLSGLPRDWGVHWNAVPWYVGKQEKIRAVTPAEVVDGLEWLSELLDLLGDLRVILAMGVPARKAVHSIGDELSSRGIDVVTTWHPSPRNYNSRPGSRADVLDAFTKAFDLARRG